MGALWVWYFRQPSPGETTRDPIVGEFFATDAISGAAEAIVREGIQNALDAGLQSPVHVRILLANDSHALPASQMVPWLEQAWPHLRAAGNGLRDVPAEMDGCSYLVFEDFGTSGLKGSVDQAFDEPNTKNGFFYFFRAEGRTGKGDSDRGRWGVGKHVFPRASRINAVFGLTVRSDDQKRLLMGHIVLKSHKIGPKHWSPDGHFGLRPDKLVLPSEEQTLLEKFKTAFRLRREKEPGLSLVVPYLDDEISYRGLVRAVADGYFYPILCGQLTVEVEAAGHQCSVTADTLVDVALELADDNDGERLARVELAEWAAKRQVSDFFHLQPCSSHRPVWSDELIPSELVPVLRAKLLGGEKIAVRIPILVRRKGERDQPTYFDLFIWQRDNDDGRPIFIREGLTITDVRGTRARGVLSLVVAKDKPIATLLGDSENPAHTQWQRDSSNFKNKYVSGSAHIDFVKRAVAKLVGVLRDSGEKYDVSTLADIFPRPAIDEVARQSPIDGVRPKPKPDVSDIVRPTIVQKPVGYRLQQVKGGFSIQPGHKDATIPPALDVRVAYDIRQGNPLKKYHEADFQLDRAPIKIEKKSGVEIRQCSGNEISFEITDADFNLTVGGFDQNRDLYVNVRIAERDNA